MKRNYEKRMKNLQKNIVADGLDAMLITSQESIYYLTGADYDPVERPFFIIAKKEGVPMLVVPKMEFAHMSKVGDFGKIDYYEEFPTIDGACWYDKLNFLLADAAIKVLGIEPSLPSGNMRKIQTQEIRISTCIEDARVKKLPDEIEALRESAKYSTEGIRLLHKGLYVGQTVLESTAPARKLQENVICSVEKYSPIANKFTILAWPAPQSAQPHSVPDIKSQMGRGPIVLLSYNTIQGYATECERTVFLNEPTEREREFFNHMIKAREIVFSMIKPGVRCEDLDIATKDYFKSQGLEKYVLHRTGHGFGMNGHERPWCSLGGTEVLEKNMLISVEPAIYINEIGGFRHSDTVLVTENGYEVLTKYPTDIDSLIIKENKPIKKLIGKIIQKKYNC